MHNIYTLIGTSLPSRERGLKLNDATLDTIDTYVAPFAGAWIETREAERVARLARVAPFAGAWIETR